MIGRGSTLRHPSGLLVLVDVLRYCDTAQEHEVRIITDGLRAYAPGATTEAGPGWRVSTQIGLTCGQPVRDDQPCDGSVYVDLAEPGVWVAATPEAERLLTAYGQELDR